jgi:PAS domain S-box-containing protein
MKKFIRKLKTTTNPRPVKSPDTAKTTKVNRPNNEVHKNGSDNHFISTMSTAQELCFLLNNTEESFVVIDTSFRIIIHNEQFTRQIKKYLGRKVLKGDCILDYTQPARREMIKQLYERVFAGETAESEIELSLEGEGISTFCNRFKPAFDQNKTIIGATVTTIDITEKKKSAQLLIANEKRFRTLVENSGDGIIVLSPHGKAKYVSPSVGKILGYTEQEVLQVDIFGLVHPDEIPLVNLTMEKAMANPGLPIQAPAARVRHRDGRWRWLEATVTNMLHDPSIDGIVDNFRDVTEKIIGEQQLQRSREQLREERKLLRTLVDNLPINVYTKDTELRKTLANRADFEYCGFDNEEAVLGKSDFDFFSHESAANSLSQDREILRTGEGIIGSEERHVKIDGRETWFLISKIPLKNAEGKVNGLLGISYNISERRETEEKIRIAKERYELVNKATNDVIYEWDIANNVSYWGEGYETVFGLTRTLGETSSQTWVDNLHPDEREELLETTLAAFKEKKQTLSRELRFRCGDGTYKTVFDNLIILYSPQGIAVKIVGAMKDITELKKNEISIRELNENLNRRALELANSNAELERFAYVASHDLQEPLRMVSSFMQLLQKKYENQLDETASQYISYAVDGAERMKQLILDLLEYSRVGTNQDNRVKTDMNDLTNQVLNIFSDKIQQTGAVIKVDPLPAIKVNASQVAQLMQNLIGNAFKYNKSEKPEVEIGCMEQNNAWQFYIKDNGIGIDPKFYDKVFVIFQRLHNKNQYSGTGIGLAICKKIVEKHGGTIWIESAPGKGSTFFFTIKK